MLHPIANQNGRLIVAAFDVSFPIRSHDMAAGLEQAAHRVRVQPFVIDPRTVGEQTHRGLGEPFIWHTCGKPCRPCSKLCCPRNPCACDTWKPCAPCAESSNRPFPSYAKPAAASRCHPTSASLPWLAAASSTVSFQWLHAPLAPRSN